jgi:2-C-methyl-D-erythritol 2,4-cyclodiphosphate synthase
VPIPHDRGLEGHSDADVVAHAVCDAIFGALGLSDLGSRFPDTAAENRGRSSLDFLRAAGDETRRLGWEIGNVDAVILAEAPRLAPHLEAMRRATAAAIGCPPDRVVVRAKHAEGLGAVGRGEGMVAQAVAVLVRAPRRRPRGRR